MFFKIKSNLEQFHTCTLIQLRENVLQIILHTTAVYTEHAEYKEKQ